MSSPAPPEYVAALDGDAALVRCSDGSVRRALVLRWGEGRKPELLECRWPFRHRQDPRRAEVETHALEAGAPLPPWIVPAAVRLASGDKPSSPKLWVLAP